MLLNCNGYTVYRNERNKYDCLKYLSMVYACPQESDPREKLQQFVTDPEMRIIAGLRTEGLDALVNMVESKIRENEPDATIIRLDRDVLSDNMIDLPRDLEAYFDRTAADHPKVRFLMSDEIPIINWQSAIGALKGKDAQIFCFSVACRQIPACSKLL